MTSPAEKLAIDVTMAAMDGATRDLGDNEAVVKKVSILLGLAVYVCREHGLTLELAHQCLDHRWEDYSEHFHDA